MNTLHSTLAILILVSAIIIMIIMLNLQSEKTDTTSFLKNTKCYVINLEKDTERMSKFRYYYKNSDISELPYERFNAINGKQIDVSKYVSQRGLVDINNSETLRYRTKHYQLTMGAVGCYLSHLTLYKRLLEDPNHEYYLIFEDDVEFNKDILQNIMYYENNAPENWDLLIFGAIREFGDKQSPYIRYNYFWGLNCYLINKKGARKIVEENEINMQIDSAMNVMIRQNRLNVYGTLNKLTKHEYVVSNIQIPVIYKEGIDVYDLSEFI